MRATNIQLESLLGAGKNKMNKAKPSTCSLQEVPPDPWDQLRFTTTSYCEDELIAGVVASTECSLRAVSLAVLPATKAPELGASA